MVRPSSLIWKHFRIEKSSGKRIAHCKYCTIKYAFPNATRMRKHILCCQKCPIDIKQLFSSVADDNPVPDEPQAVAPRSCTRSPTQTSGSSSFTTASCSHDNETRQKCQMKQTSTITSFVDTITSKNKEDIDSVLARAIYASGTPLSITENKYWQQAFKLIRPSYQLPSRYSLSKPLLDAEYMRIMEKVEQQLNEALCLSLISDGWTNIRGDSVINFIICTPKPVFYKSIDASEKKHTAEYISNQMIQVIEKIGSEKFFALITDNGSSMKAAWEIITEKYPNITALGCFAHGMNLVMNDIMSLQTMENIFKKAKRVVKHIKGAHILSSSFKMKQNEKLGKNKATTLKLPSKTRWNRVVIMFESLKHGKQSLQEIAIMKDVNMDKEIRQLILDNDVFWVQLQNSLKILDPIALAITKSESNDALLSDVPQLWCNVASAISSNLTTSPLNSQEEKNVVEILNRRKIFCCQKIHAAANLLDPRYKGGCLSDDDICNAFDFITEKSNHLKLDTGKVISNVAEYRSSSGFWSRKSIWESAKYINPTTWWSGLCTAQPLNPLASRLLQVPPTSAACERNWSAFGNIHTKLRNRLTTGNVEKLVAIRWNLDLFNEEPIIPTSFSSSSAESINSDSDTE
jgi:hypothetical protein